MLDNREDEKQGEAGTLSGEDLFLEVNKSTESSINKEAVSIDKKKKSATTDKDEKISVGKNSGIIIDKKAGLNNNQETDSSVGKEKENSTNSVNEDSRQSSNTGDNSQISKIEDNLSEKTHGDKNNFFIVGIGASAGGLEALRLFFTNTPPDIGMAFIVVSHMSTDHRSLLCELLANFTQMKIFEAREGMNIQPNCIYVIPPGKDMAVLHGELQLFEPVTLHGVKHPIDFFFRSLSKDAGEKAVGVVLSGTGTEGTQGIRDIKGEGGMVVVQSPESAKFEHMPVSAIATGLVDFVLSPGEMPECIIRYKEQSVHLFHGYYGAKIGKSPSSLNKLLALIRNKTGNDFSLYKQNTVIRRIERRMSLNQIARLSEYIKYLKTNDRELFKLNKEFLINVTSFFRDPATFQFIKNEILPKVFNYISENEYFRVWIPGCSTGEEAYSMAIIIREFLNEHGLNTPFKVFATDLDEESVETARRGIYPDSIGVDVSPQRLKKFFKKNDVTYTIKEEIRNSLVFAPHNVIKDPPFSRMDIISCRNLMIYLNADVQKYLIRLFHYALKPDGILVLGSSESIGDFFDLFGLINKKQRIYKVKPKEKQYVINMGVASKVDKIKEEARINPKTFASSKKVNIKKELENVILSNFSPPCIVTDVNGDILYVYGRIGRFFEPSAGKASLNIFSMARNEIKNDIKFAVKKAQSQRKEITIEKMPIQKNGDTEFFDVMVTPVFSLQHIQELILIIFREVKLVKANCSETKTEIMTRSEMEDYCIKLEQELQITRESLQNTIEDLDISNEELKSANEELQSINEELQSTNEELEISREELQSVNEELITLNSELSSKVDELTQVSNDMENLLASTDIATIFLDKNLNIKRFTPATKQIMRLITTDVGRSITDIKSDLIYDNLPEDIEEVLSTLRVKTREIKDTLGRYYLMKILPYKTINDVIDGVVVVFMDISTTKTIKEEREKIKNQYRNLFESAFEGIVLIDADSHKIIEGNREFQRQVSRNNDNLINIHLWDMMVSEEKRMLLKKAIELPKENQIFEVELKKPDDSKIQLQMKILSRRSTNTGFIQCITKDITGERQTSNSLKQAQELSGKIFELFKEPLIVLDKTLKIVSINEAFSQSFNCLKEEIVGRHLFGIMDNKLQISGFKQKLEKLFEIGEPLNDFKLTFNIPGIGKKIFHIDSMILSKKGDIIERVLLIYKGID